MDQIRVRVMMSKKRREERIPILRVSEEALKGDSPTCRGKKFKGSRDGFVTIALSP